MPLQQHVLDWLYSVLSAEYYDVNRIYNDVAQALAQYPSLSPRTDVHTSESGDSALLLLLAGTLPVVFRGQTYRFPISLWVPHAYPREAPLVYVTPTEVMVVRPGQHVDPQGQVYHPYLAGWSAFWDKSTIVDFLAILVDIFAKEPPVMSRVQIQAPLQLPTPPPLPPHPNQTSLDSQGEGAAQSSSTPPRPPPKRPTSFDPAGDSYRHVTQSPRNFTNSRYRPGNGSYDTNGIPASNTPVSGSTTSRYESAPPLPQDYDISRRPVSTELNNPPLSSIEVFSPSQLGSGLAHPPPPNNRSIDPAHVLSTPFHSDTSSTGWSQSQSANPLVNSRTLPAPDLLDDTSDLSILVSSGAAPPPIPPNPERQALMRQLAQTLYEYRQRTRQQNQSSMAGLEAQRTAMSAAFARLHNELGELSQVSSLLTANAGILHETLQKADSVTQNSSQQKVPDTDDLLVAPTVVSGQLYALVAEERALGDTIFVLGRAVERSCITPAVFAKTTRGLAREWYLRKALVRKISIGMGLLT